MSNRSPQDSTRSRRVESEIAGLWRDHKRTGDPEPLLLHYWSLVERTAGRIGSDLPQFVERADLVSYGLVGLLDAIGKFDGDRGVKFESYAALRIRGAILDGLRTADWVPRSVRASIRDIRRAEGTLQATLHRMPTEAELAAAIGITTASLRKLAADAVLSRIVPLDDAQRAVERAESSAVLSRDVDDDQPGHALEVAERRRAVTEAIEGLCDRDRTVIDLYYYRGLKLTEIGRMLGVTEARVSQLNSRARSALKKHLLAVDF